ncbi:HAD family hydrolase [Herbiconiux sp. L3-i23]|uniref:HAD family hydrolase n=1 Tax=Herbiconiux sp. L3-i23 TaxID=2905871 RepID=UPI002061227F|nr:HAD family hydrolase [Herbiconiux sp. L3-i23]BDI22581.1 haloacid dehalogenase [Herbiconiux sp. L3-i23]
MSEAKLQAVLFDIDGTLVDSNYLHVDAWMRAFAAVERYPDAAFVHEAIGLDSAKLLERLLGEEGETEVADRAKELHGEYYEASAERLRRFDGVRELFAAVRDRGFKVVLASSAPQEELDILLKVLEADDLIDAATTSSDVETAKPEPDVIGVALEKAGVEPDEAIMVGDTRWDIEAARRAGVDTIAVLTGGRGKTELVEAGAVAVHTDVAELFEELDRSPIGRRSQHTTGR